MIKICYDWFMELQYVKAFPEVGKSLNFTKAAHSLGVTQAAISRQIRLFEENLGEQLVLRSPQKVVLTERGRELLGILKETDSRLKSDFLKEGRKTIRIGIIEGVLINWFLDRLEGFFSKYDYNFEIVVDRSSLLKTQVEESKLDILIGGLDIETGVLSSRKILKEEFVLISKKPLSKENRKIEEHTWITYSETDPLMSQKRKAERIISVNSIFSMQKLVEKGMGIAVIPSHCLEKGSKLYSTPWKSRKSEIYLTTQNFSIIPQWLKDIQKELI